MGSYQVEETQKMSIEGASRHRTLRAPQVICIEADTPQSAFVEAAVWLHKNPGFTLISTSFTYLFDEDEVQLLLTVE